MHYFSSCVLASFYRSGRIANIGSWPISSRADDLLFRFSNTNKIQIYMHVPVFDRIETKSVRDVCRVRKMR